MNAESLFAQILEARGISDLDAFAVPDYGALADPFLLPDMDKAVDRISKALEDNEVFAVYGDYDIDGLTATTILTEALEAFGATVHAFIPDRFIDGYGMSNRGIDELKSKNVSLLLTVDTGSLSHEHVTYAKQQGIDVIVTDHHTTGKTLPDAVAVINPKREDSTYPCRDLAGVGVAFTLVRGLQQAAATSMVLQQRGGLAAGQEKWLLDLVAMGTVCDVVPLTGENRTLVYWGIQVMKKTRRHGIKALAEVSDVDMSKVNTETFGFRFGPRLNASGRLDTARVSLDLLTANDVDLARQKANQLQEQNELRRKQQAVIFDEASLQAEQFADDNVLVLAGEGWSHGIVGIVASKITEQFEKPTFVLEINGDTTKGSARSFGDFHLANVIADHKHLLEKGGGHAYAAGITIDTNNLDEFRAQVNKAYKQKSLKDQTDALRPVPDITLKSLDGIDGKLLELLSSLEPYGASHERPRFLIDGVVKDWRPVGADKKHAKATIADTNGNEIDAIGFNMAQYMPAVGEGAVIIFAPEWNEFRGRKTVQLQLLDVVAH